MKDVVKVSSTAWGPELQGTPENHMPQHMGMS